MRHLKIPQRGGSLPAIATGRSGGTSRTHTVRRGDSLWRLASPYDSTVDRIKQDNGLRGHDLSIGQKLAIRTRSGSGSRSYTVRRGDTIGRIAHAQIVSVERLRSANGLSQFSTIYPGQVIRFPN